MTVDELVQEIEHHKLRLQGTLRIWGIEYSRPYGNYYVVERCEHRNSFIRICFDEGEVLSVWSPEGLHVVDNGLLINDAAKVRWEWYLYEWPKVPGKPCVQEIRRTQAGLEIEHSGENAGWPQLNGFIDSSLSAVLLK